MSNNESKTFNCDLNDSNLFSCILKEVGEEQINIISSSNQKIQDKTFINCINASLVTCLRINREELDFPKVQLELIKNESGTWLINQINIIVDKTIEKKLVYERINQCLKFVKKACKTEETLQLAMIESTAKENLKSYKVQLTELNQIIDKVREDKSKKEKLFLLFKEMSSNV